MNFAIHIARRCVRIARVALFDLDCALAELERFTDPQPSVLGPDPYLVNGPDAEA